MKKNIYIFLSICLIFSYFGCQKNIPTAPENQNEIDFFMTFYNVPGVSIAVIKDFKIDTLEVHGVKDVLTQEPVTVQTLFQAASISKSVSAMAALRLVQDGKMSLDEDINQTLSSWQLPENAFTSNVRVTLKHLLSHTAGTTVHGFRGYRYSEDRPTLVQVLNGTSPANSPPIVVDVTPGTIYRYSGGGFCIMQQAVIDVEDDDFPQILQEIVLTPLAMQSSTFEQPLPQQSLGRAAKGHYDDESYVPGNHHIYPEMAAAGLWTTPADLAYFLIEIQLSLEDHSNQVLNKALTELMLTPVLSDEYGLGFGLIDISGEAYFGHGGANEGFRCFMMAHKKVGVGAVIMTNSDNGSELADKIIGIIAERENWPGY